jgi:hypothetical protein
VPKLIERLDWNDDNEAHVSSHGIDPTSLDQIAQSGDDVTTRNKRPHPTDRIRMIGRDHGGQLVTSILAPTSEPGQWRPVTAWRSTGPEKAIYATTKRG